ncbi:hypothetical protein ASE52_11985 [Acidovorax sp. Root275]|uniref:hypothetical protein n=1 Tax=Acidovorax sp. Root275 TaxID=1736508 RepID=UPI00070C1DD8|nr:hypothetical protein [Acidovorax sp. Root275]KRD48106.1 hypothetical protein ASE52_11985 [Acidovorax sp. Root275]
MKIESSTLQMQAQHAATRMHSQTSRLEMWVGDRPTRTPPARQAPPLQISNAARLAQAAHATHAAAASVEPLPERDPDEGLTPQLAMIRDLIERMTGVLVRIYAGPQSSDAPAATPPTPAPANSAAAPPRQRAGFGVIYEQREVLEETERTQFAAAGTVRTADGQEIRFTLQLDMQRSYRAESSVSLRLGDAVAVDPLVVNFDGTAAQLQNLRFAFDLDGDGQTEQVPLLAGNRGYLALDTNQNARIDNGLELFGPDTGNGFSELARHDSDGNGWIDEADPVFEQLRVWTPNADGTGRLQTLEELGVGAIQLGAQATPLALRTADNGSLGAVRSTSIYLRENGSAGTVQQIDLNV